MTGKGTGQTQYVKCQMCGFLIEATANAIGPVPPPPEPEDRRGQRRSFVPLGVALIMILALAWAIAAAVQWARSIQ